MPITSKEARAGCEGVSGGRQGPMGSVRWQMPEDKSGGEQHEARGGVSVGRGRGRGAGEDERERGWRIERVRGVDGLMKRICALRMAEMGAEKAER